MNAAPANVGPFKVFAAYHRRRRRLRLRRRRGCRRRCRRRRRRHRRRRHIIVFPISASISEAKSEKMKVKEYFGPLFVKKTST